MSTVDDEEQQEVNAAATLTDVINAVSERIHYAEGRRTNITIVAGVLIAGGIALFTSAYDKAVTMTAWLALAAGSISAILVGAAVLWAYTRQTNRYPWTAATKTWKWFYRDALPEGSKFDIGWTSLFSFGKEKAKVQSEYTRQLPLFKEKLKALTLPNVSYEQDLQQLYVLHINEKYKNLHLSQLRTILGRVIFLIVISMILAALVGEARDASFARPYDVELKRPGYSMHIHWHNERVGGGSEAIVTTTIINQSTKVISAPTWQGSDKYGNPIPSELDCTLKPGTAILPKHTSSYSCLLKPYGQATIIKLWAKVPESIG
jgi:hypothetical protein